MGHEVISSDISVAVNVAFDDVMEFIIVSYIVNSKSIILKQISRIPYFCNF